MFASPAPHSERQVTSKPLLTHCNQAPYLQRSFAFTFPPLSPRLSLAGGKESVTKLRMHSFLPVLFATAVTMCAAQAQKPREVPAEQRPQAKPDYSQEPFVIEQFITRVRFENDGKGRRELSMRIRVQSEAGVQQLGQLQFGYNAANERLEIHSVEVHRTDGSTVSAVAEAIQDLTSPVARDAPIYTDTRQKHVTVPGLRPGEMLSYHVTTHIHTPLAPGQFWLEHDFFKDAIVLDEQLEVSVPRDRAIKLKTQPGAEPAVTEEADRRIYRWKTAHLKREDDDQEETAPKKKPQKKPTAPAIQLTTFQSWEEVGRWYAALERERATPNEAVHAKAQGLIRGRATDAEKVEALYDYVAKNFRYVSLSFGLGRYQPHAAAEVLVNQYGDCKDKHTLLESLVEAIGLRAYPVLIHSSRKIDPDVPSPAQFDHVISVVAFGSESSAWFWLDTTTEVAPFQMLSSNLRDKMGLVVAVGAPEGQTGRVTRLVETPLNPPFTTTQRVEVTGQVSDLGKLTAHVRSTLRGDNELILRLAFRKTPQNQWKQLGQLLALSDGFRGEVTDVKGSDPAATREPFQVEYRIAQPNYLHWAAKKSQLPLPLPAISLPDAPDAESEADTEPVELGTPLEVTTRVELELPAKFAARAPVAVGVLRDYAEYHSSYRVEGSKVIAERSLRFKLRQLPAARTRDYVAFTRAVRADEGQSVSLENSSAGVPAIPEIAKAADLYESGVAALRSGNHAAATQMLERAVQLEPKHKHAWNDLGRTYSLQGQLDKVVAATRKQIEINPYDEHANLFLGLILLRQQKYDESAQALQKQLELNPLDGGAHAALGTVYLESKKYTEAVPELEKAVALQPNAPELQVGLGQAYLNLGKNDEALAAFDKAVEMAPAPPVWNNVAYQLTLKGVHLDRAQQYAESAVAATAAALRNAALERLRPEDLASVIGLAA